MVHAVDVAGVVDVGVVGLDGAGVAAGLDDVDGVVLLALHGQREQQLHADVQQV